MKVLFTFLLTVLVGPLFAAEEENTTANTTVNAAAEATTNAAATAANEDLDLAAAEAEADLEIAATCDCALDVAACRAQGYSCAEYCVGKDTPECAAANEDYTKAETETNDADDTADIFES